MRRVLQAVAAALNLQAGEGVYFSLMLLAHFVIGIARCFSWTAGNALFLKQLGSENQPYLYLFTSVLIPLLTAGYLRAERRCSFRLLTVGSFVSLFVFTVVLRWLLWASSASWIVFFAAVSYDVIFFLTNIGFWTLAGQLFDVRQAKRLYPLIGSGEWIATVLGGFATPWIVSKIGTANLFWPTAASLALALGIVLYVLRRSKPPVTETTSARSEPEPQRPSVHPLKNPYVAFMLLNNALSIVAQFFLDNSLYGLMEKRYADADQLAEFLGLFWAWISLVILVSRSFLTSRLLSRFGVNIGLLALPVAVLVGVSLFDLLGLAAGIETGLAFWVLALTRFADASLRNDLDATAGLILYQPLPSQQRSWAQAANDGIFVPVAMGVAGILLLVVKKALGFGSLEIALVIPVIVIMWIVSGFSVTRRYPQMLAAAIAGHRFDATHLPLNHRGSTELLVAKLASRHAGEVLYAMSILEESDANRLRKELPHLLRHENDEVRGEAVRTVARLDERSAAPLLRECLTKEASMAVRSEALRALARTSETLDIEQFTPYLTDTEPELRLAAAVGLMQNGGLEGVVAATRFFDAWRNSAVATDRRLAARLLGDVGISNFYRPLLPLLHDADPQVRVAAVTAAGKLRIAPLWPAMLAALNDIDTRSVALTALVSQGVAVLPILIAEWERCADDAAARIRLLCVVQALRSPAATAFLERQCETPHPEVLSQVLRALAACNYRLPEQATSRATEHLRRAGQQTAWLMAATTALPADESCALLNTALDELRKQVRDRVYYWLSFRFAARPILDSRDNLESKSAERRAYAVELIDSTIDKSWQPLVLPLLEDLPPVVRWERLSSALQLDQRRPTAADVICEIIRGGNALFSDWLRTSAIVAAVRLAMHAAIEPLREVSTNERDALLRRAASWALAELNAPNTDRAIASPTGASATLENASPFVARRLPGGQSMLLDIEKILILKSVPLFAEASDHLLAQIGKIVEAKEVAAGERIISQGDLGTSMFVIVSGRVRVHTDDREIAILGERQVFGELAILDPEPRFASVTAIEPTQLFQITQATIYELMANHVEIARGIIRVLCRRIRDK